MPKESVIKKHASLLIAVKSKNIEVLTSAYNFTQAVITYKNINLKTIFFYQEAIYINIDSDISVKWKNLINKYQLNATICKGSCSKRGISIKDPFQANSLINFIDMCETVDRIIQF